MNACACVCLYYFVCHGGGLTCSEWMSNWIVHNLDIWARDDCLGKHHRHRYDSKLDVDMEVYGVVL